MFRRFLYQAKLVARILDAGYSFRKAQVALNGELIEAYKTRWWNEASDVIFQEEIAPYFRYLPALFSPRIVIDAGVSSGMFSVAAAKVFKGSRIYGFEPSRRNRILAGRNVRLNEVQDAVEIIPFGLWNVSAELAFRSHGGISSIEQVSSIPNGHAFLERIPVLSLDEWVRQRNVGKIDLIKMDIEGAEIEALQGAQEVLRKMRPVVLLQAYHLRNGKKTCEQCMEMLNSYGYQPRLISGYESYIVAE